MPRNSSLPFWRISENAEHAHPLRLDNYEHRLADVLNEVLAAHTGRCLDVASACFTVGGYGVVREQLANVGSVQLLPGAEPVHGEQIGSRPDAARVRGLMRRDLDSLAFDEATLRLVEDLIALEAALDG